MARSSIMGGDPAPARAPGNDVDALGPSNSSDSGSDMQGARPMATEPDNAAEWGAIVAEGASDTDADGTGERAAAAGDSGRDNGDILPDRVIAPGMGTTASDTLGEVAEIGGDDGDSLDDDIEGTGADDDAV